MTRKLEGTLAEVVHNGSHPPISDLPYDPLPYRAGYQRAEFVRQHFGLPGSGPVTDLDAIMHRAVGSESLLFVQQPDRRNVEAVVQRNGACGMAGTERSPRALRFLRARALHHWLFVTDPHAPRRLLTRANDRQQAASRAFAAELLAPAAALAARLEGGVDWDIEEQLADEFDVSRNVIVHQLENHGLA